MLPHLSNKPIWHALGQILFKLMLRIIMFCYLAVLSFLKVVRQSKRPLRDDGLEILVTGTFHSDNWLETHLRPIASAQTCKKVRMVASSPVPRIDNVEAVYPPKFLVNIIGPVPSRLVTFAIVALRTRPDIMGGFHILINGLLSVLLARGLGIRSLYICGGGPSEVRGGGYLSENRIFSKLDKPDFLIERILLKTVAECDLVITMGGGAIQYFNERGVNSNFHIVPGGFNNKYFYPAKSAKEYDLILIGRLAPVKRVDVFLEAIQLTKEKYPEISAVIVGDGSERSALERIALRLDIADNVIFAGWQNNVDEWLRKSRVFVLTSDSEGLSQALIQAMMCGVPAVVSDVGDLCDLVNSDSNGFLVKERTAENFSDRFQELLQSPTKLRQFSELALSTTAVLEMENVSKKWDEIFSEL